MNVVMVLPRDEMRALEAQWRLERAALPPKPRPAQSWVLPLAGGVFAATLMLGLLLALIRVALWGFGL